MNMQFGPAPKQSMESWLLWTGILELINIPIFYFLWLTVNMAMPGDSNLLSMIGMITTNVILLEGGLYWLAARARFFKKAPAHLRLHLLQALYIIDALLLLAFPIALLAHAVLSLPIDLPEMLFGAGLYLFGFGEFLHYFVFKINMRPYELKNALQKRQFVPARLRRELQRARREHLEAKNVSRSHANQL